MNEARLGVVHPPDEACQFDDGFVVRGHRWECRYALDVAKDLASSVVDAKESRGAVESGRLEVTKERMDGWAPPGRRPPHGVSDPDDDVDVAACEQLLVHARSIRSAASCSSRRSRSASSIASIVSPMVSPG